MGIFDFFKGGKKNPSGMRFAPMLDGLYPAFSQFGDDIFVSDVVQQAIYTIVTEMKKLRPRHIRRAGFDLAPVYDDLQRVLDNPNPLMTRSDFLEKITWNLLLNYNSFVYIERDGGGKITALYPVSPTQVTFLEQRGELYVEMLFKNGYSYTLPYSSFIHIKTHYGVDDLMGGDQFGQPDNKALLDTLELNKTLLDGVRKSLKSSFAINAIVKYNTMLDDGKIEAEIRDFEQKLQNSQSGILGVDNKAEVTQFERKLALVDEPTLKFIDEKILRHFGVPLEILRGDYTVEQYQAFYQKTLEPLIISYSEAFTKRLFTERERGFDNEVIFYPKELIFMSTQQTLEMVNLLGQSGALFENEKRVAFGLEPLEELRGVRKMSLNYVDVQIANAYQMGLEQNPADTEEVVVDEDKTEA